MKKQTVSQIVAFSILAFLPLAALADEVGTDSGAPRRQKLLDRVGDVTVQGQSINQTAAFPRTKPCSALEPFKDAAYATYALALFYPPLHSDAELPELGEFFGLEERMVKQTSIIGDFCDPQNAQTHPKAAEVHAAVTALEEIAARLRQIALDDVAQKNSETPALAAGAVNKASDIERVPATPSLGDVQLSPTATSNCLPAQASAPAPTAPELLDTIVSIAAANPPAESQASSAKVVAPAEAPVLIANEAGPTAIESALTEPAAVAQGKFQCEIFSGPASCADKFSDCKRGAKVDADLGATVTTLGKQLEDDSPGFSARYTASSGEAVLKYDQYATGITFEARGKIVDASSNPLELVVRTPDGEAGESVLFLRCSIK